MSTSPRLPRLAVALAALLPLLPADAAAARSEPLFALVVGVNRPLDPRTATLLYADDDAVLFHRLFSTLGISRLLVDPDPATRALHARALAAARRPTRANLFAALDELFAGIRREREAGRRPELYLVYSGHGDTENNEGFLVLADGRLTRSELADRILARSPATTNHVIVDACNSYALVQEKRAGGDRRPARGPFPASIDLPRRFPQTGFLLSTSSATSSHEWAEFQGGIFSHEVRSGLLGAADIDLDGRVSYDEMWAFIQVANSRIPNERLRPRIYARAPAGDGARSLLDARWSSVGGAASAPTPAPRAPIVRIPFAGRYLVEDSLGVRLADLHADSSAPVTLWLPADAAPGRIYLHDLEHHTEYALVLPPDPEPVSLAQRAPDPSSYRAKGAAHEAFARIFEQPFGLETYSVELTCSPQRVREAPCPSYTCDRCRCEGCRRIESSPAPVSDLKASSTSLQPWQQIFSISMGLRATSRRFSISEPVDHRPASYSADWVPMIAFEGEFCPLAIGPYGRLSDLCLSGRFGGSLSLKTASDGKTLDTEIWSYSFGLRYRWNLLWRATSPVLLFAVEGGAQAFEIKNETDARLGASLLPNVEYDFVKIAVGIEQPLFARGPVALSVAAGFDYRLVVGAGQITSDSYYGHGTAGGIEAGGGIKLRLYGLIAEIAGFYDRYFMSFDQSCITYSKCLIAGGAVEELYGLLFMAGYQYH
jgi:hypothetical protein